MAVQPEQPKEPQQVVNRPVANQQGRHLMLESTANKEKRQNKPSKDIHKDPSNQEHGVRHKREVLMQMKDQTLFIDKVKSADLAAFPQMNGIDKKHFPPIVIRSLKSAKEDK